MEITFLQADNGDAIHMRFTDPEGNIRNVLIDGGMQQTYQFKNKKNKPEDGALKKLITDLRLNAEKFDLVILTHVDQDHIGGLISWLEKDLKAHEMIGKVWFNSGSLIKEKLDSDLEAPSELQMIGTNGLQTSIAEGVTFEKYLILHDKWDRKLLFAGESCDFHGLTFNLLSPGLSELADLLAKWKDEKPESLLTAKSMDHHRPLLELLTEDRTEIAVKFEEDDSVHNGSSLAFLISWSGNDLLLLGDAFPSVVLKALQDLGYTKNQKLQPVLTKLSHHASLGSNSKELLSMINSKKFVVSTDSSRHNHPHKKLLARLIDCHSNCEIYFNYPELIGGIFTKQDHGSFPNFQAKPVEEPFIF